MSQLFKIACRGSLLSLAQADIVKKKLRQLYINIDVEVVTIETRGDFYHGSILAELEGKDFFTKDIQDYLLTGQADFAVHSLKDVSGEDFFNDTHYAIVDRQDPRDVAIFHPDVISKLSRGEKITIGTSSPRRTEMAKNFLLKALPRYGTSTQIEPLPIRGNVDTRLQKLQRGEYDAIILACAGLNRLLEAETAKEKVESLLRGNRLMVLPLLDCPPAPGQGAIVVECGPHNLQAVHLLKGINNLSLSRAVDLERKIAHQYGSGCHQKFGVIHIDTGHRKFIHAAGTDRFGHPFSVDFSEDGLVLADTTIPVIDDLPEVPKEILLIKKREALSLADVSPTERVWVQETSSWFSLSEKGIWVEGSLEGLGINFITPTLKSSLLNVPQLSTQIPAR